MSFEPSRMPPSRWVFRGMLWSWIDKKNWAAKVKAFLREPKDDDGITVAPEPCLCCSLAGIGAIGAIKVGDIESLSDPITSKQLYVYQDKEDHALIVGVPFRHEHEKEAHDLAILLADVCNLLTKEEAESARREWVSRSAASNANSVSERPE